jgi:phosphatidylglycerophosphate synthase
MRKIEKHMENPIDNYLIDFADYLSPYFYKLNFTPNGITTLSLITGLLSVFLIHIDYYILAGIMFFVSYFFDCMDGFYARKYQMVTKFGDLYDHIKDAIVFSLTALFIYIKTYHKLPLTIIIGIFTLLAMIHLGCQEIVYQKQESDTLVFTKNLCPYESSIYLTRYFGCGTLFVVVSLIIAFGIDFRQIEKNGLKPINV